MDFKPTHATLSHEGCNLHYWYTGNGPLITFIPGASGHGTQYNNLMSLLSPSFTCLTYDRCQTSTSTSIPIRSSQPFSATQQARDVYALITSLGFSSFAVFGSSLGGLIAFQFAVDYPAMAERVIAHEAPTCMLMPDSVEVYDFLYSCYALCQTASSAEAGARSRSRFVGYDDADADGDLGVPGTIAPPRHDAVHLWENEFLPTMAYTPDLRRVRDNGTSVAVMAGEKSRDAWYARTTFEQANIMGCSRVVAPGHHEGFQVEAEAFAPVLVELLHEMEMEKHEDVKLRRAPREWRDEMSGWGRMEFKNGEQFINRFET